VKDIFVSITKQSVLLKQSQSIDLEMGTNFRQSQSAGRWISCKLQCDVSFSFFTKHS